MARCGHLWSGHLWSVFLARCEKENNSFCSCLHTVLTALFHDFARNSVFAFILSGRGTLV